MIIEGRHAEVGNGIFISDIQPESVAEQVISLARVLLLLFTTMTFFFIVVVVNNSLFIVHCCHVY